MEISFNTLVNARITGQNRDLIGIAPQNLRIANNIIQLDIGNAVSAPHPFLNVTYEGNILWGAAAPGDIPASGFQHVNPRLQLDASAHYHLGAGSPAIDGAVGASLVTDDIEGQPRIKPDIGADEWSMAPTLRRPLLPADVGPGAP